MVEIKLYILNGDYKPTNITRGHHLVRGIIPRLGAPTKVGMQQRTVFSIQHLAVGDA